MVEVHVWRMLGTRMARRDEREAFIASSADEVRTVHANEHQKFRMVSSPTKQQHASCCRRCFAASWRPLKQGSHGKMTSRGGGVTLTAWHQRLRAQFMELRIHRSAAVGADKAIFALEHGLTAEEVTKLQSEIRKNIVQGPPGNEHSLPWIVYASEAGYQYSGDEYWQTFEQKTPGWSVNGSREWLRERFQWFAKQFGGARPSGAWAENFSIICWPITHAVLPRDLQQDLAETLYYMRELFSEEILTSPDVLGERIAGRSWNAGSRFRNLAREPVLVGTIAAALLLQTDESPPGLIQPATLKRIRDDLERVQAARDWLRWAQRAARQSVQFRGLSTAREPQKAERPQQPPERALPERIATEPRLILQPTADGRWDVVLELQELSPLVARFPRLREALSKSRFVVTGSSGRLRRGDAMLYGTLPVKLHKWPGPSEVLLRFDQRMPPELDARLRTECRLRPGPKWLCRVASDNLAYELRGQGVRPNQRYILLSSEPIKFAATGITAKNVALNCADLHAIELSTPKALSENYADGLSSLGLSQAKAVRVWPAGLAAAAWDGEGRGEWLATETPSIGILVDHAVPRLSLSLDGVASEQLELSQPKPGAPLFVELPRLRAGVYKVRVSIPTDGASSGPAGELALVIREPRAWIPSVNGQGVLSVRTEPTTPTLEQLWEGRATLDIGGPIDRVVDVRLSLLQKDASKLLIQKRLSSLKLPVDANGWGLAFEKFFRGASDVQKAYDQAHSCVIDVNAEELGTFTLKCDREFLPLRWTVRNTSHGYVIRLNNDSGTKAIEVQSYSFQRPDRPVSELATSFETSKEVNQGGLFLARCQGASAAVIIPPRVKTLVDVKANPTLKLRPRKTQALEEILSIAEIWSQARVTGDLFAASRQRDVLCALTTAIFALVSGDKWEKADRIAASDRSNLDNLRALISHDQVGIGRALKEEAPRLSNASVEDRVARLGVLARTYLRMKVPGRLIPRGPGVALFRNSGNDSPDDPAWLAQFALRMASAPHEVRDWAGEHLTQGLANVLATPVLAKSARYLVLAIHHSMKPRPMGTGQLYQGWEWP